MNEPAQPIEPKQLDTVVTCRMPSEVAAHLRDQANFYGITLSELLRRMSYQQATTPMIRWNFKVTA